MTPFSAKIDLSIAKMTFYRNLAGVQNGEHGFYSNAFFDFIYLYGVLPAQIICAAAGICLILSRWLPNLKRFRGACAVISLTLFIGSLFITHTLLKECWGRPRPRQVIEFGGQQPFRAFYQPLFKSAPEPSKSFPSGHSTCGFYFFCLYFLGKRFNRQNLARFGLVFGASLGIVLSMARIVQGGHFISDVYISALIMWFTAYFCDYLVFDAPVFVSFRQAFLGKDTLALRIEPNSCTR